MTCSVRRVQMVIIGAIAFGAAACSPRPVPLAGATARQLVWLHTGARVTGVTATLVDISGQRLSTVDVRDGRIAVPHGAASVRVVDRAHDGIVLLDQPLGDASAIRVPEAIRVRGRLTGAHAGTTIRIGSGERVDAAERHTTDHGKQWMRHDADRTAFGLAIPRSSRWWSTSRSHGDRFESGWIAAATPPQLVVFDGDVHGAAVDVPLPDDLSHGATVDAGAVPLTLLHAIDLNVSVPDGRLPAALMINLVKPVVEPARSDDVARWLSVLDQFNPALFEHFVLRAPLFVPSSGRLHLVGLPPLQTLDVLVLDVDSRKSLNRTVRFDGPGSSAVHVDAANFALARTGPRVTARGHVVSPIDRRPVAGARVVLADIRERYETTTGPDGQFAFDHVFADRPATIFVELPAGGGNTRVRSHIFRTVDLSRPMQLEMPWRPVLTRHSRPQLPQIGCETPTNDGQYPQLAGFVNTIGAWRSVRIVAEYQDRVFDLVPSVDGTWTFYYFVTNFFGYRGGAENVQANQPIRVQVNTPIHDTTLLQSRISFTSEGGGTARNLTVLIPSELPDLSPYEAVTDDDDEIVLNCLNVSPIPMFVQSAHGCFGEDGEEVAVAPQVRVFLKPCKVPPAPASRYRQ